MSHSCRTLPKSLTDRFSISPHDLSWNMNGFWPWEWNLINLHNLEMPTKRVSRSCGCMLDPWPRMRTHAVKLPSQLSSRAGWLGEGLPVGGLCMVVQRVFVRFSVVSRVCLVYRAFLVVWSLSAHQHGFALVFFLGSPRIIVTHFSERTETKPLTFERKYSWSSQMKVRTTQA